MLPVPESQLGADLIGAIHHTTNTMESVDCLILSGHGMVINGVFNGIQIGANGLVDRVGPILVSTLALLAQRAH